MEIDEQKRELRRCMRGLLRDFAPTGRPASRNRLISQLAGLPAWQQARTVLLFAPMPLEPDTDALWQAGQLAGKRCVYPLVDGKTLALYPVNSLAELRSVPPWSLREPVANPAARVPLHAVDVALVPGLAFDARGGRLGRGGGYYDRLLANRVTGRPVAIGVGFTFQRLDSLPLAAHDALLDMVLFC